jgi:hypothetical protein
MNRERRGEREYEALIGIPAAEALADVHAMSPEMYEAVIAGAFGGALADANLERAAREVATVASSGGTTCAGGHRRHRPCRHRLPARARRPDKTRRRGPQDLLAQDEAAARHRRRAYSANRSSGFSTNGQRTRLGGDARHARAPARVTLLAADCTRLVASALRARTGLRLAGRDQPRPPHRPAHSRSESVGPPGTGGSHGYSNYSRNRGRSRRFS